MQHNKAHNLLKSTASNTTHQDPAFQNNQSEHLSPTVPQTNSTLKVLHVIPGRADGTEMKFSRLQVESLKTLGVSNYSVFFEERTSALTALKFVRELQNAVNNFKPDILHAHYGTLTAGCCSLILGPKLLITFRGSDLNWDPAKSPLRDLASRALSQLSNLRASYRICVSNQLVRRLWSGRSNSQVITDGIDLDTFKPLDRQAARKTLGWPSAIPIILFSAKPDQIGKGKDFAIKVFEAVKLKLPDTELRILDGTKALDEVTLWMNAADCLILASLREGSPNIVKEALACGLPVVSTAVGDVSEMLRGVLPGAVVDRELEPFAEAVLKILQNPKRSNGNSRVQAFSLSNSAQHLLEVYQLMMQA